MRATRKGNSVARITPFCTAGSLFIIARPAFSDSARKITTPKLVSFLRKSLSRRLSCRDEPDLESQSFQSFDQIALHAIGVKLVEVIRP